MQHYPYQVDDDLFLGPSSKDDIGLGELLNHSCEPNAGFSNAITLVAIKPIDPFDVITIDYATCASNNFKAFRMTCNCGSTNCRKTITGQDWKIKDVQERLFKYFQPYLKLKVKR